MPIDNITVSLAPYVDRMSIEQIIAYRKAMKIVETAACKNHTKSIANAWTWNTAACKALCDAKQHLIDMTTESRADFDITAAEYCIRKMQRMVDESLSLWVSKDMQAQSKTNVALLKEHTSLMVSMGIYR